MIIVEIGRVLARGGRCGGNFGFWSGVVIFGDNQSGNIIV
jgi:hypothetical protein